MELVNPGLGLIFWMLIAFGVVFLVLKKICLAFDSQSLKRTRRTHRRGFEGCRPRP